MTIALHHGDCLEVIPRLVAEGVVCDAVVTDPPYHLTSTLARFGNINIEDNTKTSQRLRQKLDGAARLAHGFMNQKWDGGDIAFRPETWATIASVMRSGAYLVAFGGTRTFHRMVCAIEDAGFIIQDTIAWLYGSGFPKRRDMLKPAFEPICLAYKPGGKRTMQVDECRIGTGRWPANVCHDGSDEVMGVFAVAGERPACKTPSAARCESIYRPGQGEYQAQGPIYGDTGSAARFYYCAKADKEDRWGSRHPTVKPVELMKWLVSLVTPPGGLVLDPFAGSGTTGVAALATGRNAILIEREDQYIADIKERLAFYEGGGAHSIQARNRNRPAYVREGDLFAPPSEPRRPIGDLGTGWDAVFDPALDCALSYDAAIQAIGERVKAGEPLPTGGYFGNKP